MEVEENGEVVPEVVPEVVISDVGVRASSVTVEVVVAGSGLVVAGSGSCEDSSCED